MKEINVIFEIKSTNNPYLYKGIATIEKDVIRYKDDDSNVLFDLARNILIKKDNEKIVKLDFNKKIIKIIVNGIEVNSEINVLKLENKNDEIKIIYKIDENKINLNIKIISGGSYE